MKPPRVDPETGMQKYDQQKPRVELLPARVLEDVAQVLTFGAEKYEDHNWRKGTAWSRFYGATLRHLFAWAEGEDLDPESGLPHLAHALCCVMFLQDYAHSGAGTDDRYLVDSEDTLTETDTLHAGDYGKGLENVPSPYAFNMPEPRKDV